MSYVQGVCPSCGHRSLYASAGHLLCGSRGCARPWLASDLLAQRVQPDRIINHHVITIETDGWHMAHPLTCELARCEFDAVLRGWVGPMAEPGVYAWHESTDDPDKWSKHEQ